MPKVLVGMSGGVDSSAAAYLLQKDGCHVEGVTFDTGFCLRCRRCHHDIQNPSKSDLPGADEAAKVCRHLGVPHHIVRLGHQFQSKVVQAFISAYPKGLTPNPCVLCNRHIKFGALLEYAVSRGADFLATGHYVRTGESNGARMFMRGADGSKDQSYFLSYVESSKLDKILFPLGSFTKSEVREIANEAGLPVPPPSGESQDICFIAEGDYLDFLSSTGKFQENPGPIITSTGRIIGEHNGVHRYTVGQRKGLNCPAKKPYYVLGIDPVKNTVTVGFREERYRSDCRLVNIN